MVSSHFSPLAVNNLGLTKVAERRSLQSQVVQHTLIIDGLSVAAAAGVERGWRVNNWLQLHKKMGGSKASYKHQNSVLLKAS